MGQFEASIGLLPLNGTGSCRWRLPLSSPADHVTFPCVLLLQGPARSEDCWLIFQASFHPSRSRRLRIQKNLEVTPWRGKVLREIISRSNFVHAKSRIVYHHNFLGNLSVKRSTLGPEMRLFSGYIVSFSAPDLTFSPNLFWNLCGVSGIVVPRSREFETQRYFSYHLRSIALPTWDSYFGLRCMRFFNSV